ncbi:MAG: DUF6502 family protein [Gammaproteobacteria bacterium]
MRRAFVQACIQSHERSSATAERRGRVRVAKPNVSRIAVESGLSRTEVAAILAGDSREPRAAHDGRQRSERVLSGWWNDREFHDRTGGPALLKRNGPAPSFAALVKRYGGQTRVAPILNALQGSGAVRQLPDGRLQALSRTSVAGTWDRQGILALGEEIAQHLALLVHNARNPHDQRFARKVENRTVSARYAPLLRQELEDHAEVFLESSDVALNHRRHMAPRGSRDARRVCVAIQIIDEPAGGPPRRGRRRRP